MGPAEGLRDGAGASSGVVEVVIPFEGIGLKNPPVIGQMALGMLRSPITGIVEQGGRRTVAAKGAIVTDIGP